MTEQAGFLTTDGARRAQVSSGRKHSKLHQDCRGVVEHFQSVSSSREAAAAEAAAAAAAAAEDVAEEGGGDAGCAGVAATAVPAPMRDEDAWKLITLLRTAEATRIPKVVECVQVSVHSPLAGSVCPRHALCSGPQWHKLR
jgi:hypothetical protein